MKHVLAVVLLLWVLPVAADETTNHFLDALVASDAVCARKPTYFDDAPRKGSLRARSEVLYHNGPSILCKAIGKITRSDQFVVLGQSQSAFSKPWLYIATTGRSNGVWVPARHVTIGERFEYAPDAKTLESKIATASIDLNVRTCPDTLCRALGILKRDQSAPASAQATNGWIKIMRDGEDFGWVSGKYVTLADLAPEKEQVEEGEGNEQTPAASPEQPLVQPTIVAPTVDPCAYRTDYYNIDKRAYYFLHEEITFAQVPHTQCTLTKSLPAGRVVAHVATTKLFNVYMSVTEDRTDTLFLAHGQVPATLEQKGGVYREHKNFSDEMRYAIVYREQRWNSFGYKLTQFWKKIQWLYDTYTAEALSISALLLGTVMLFWRRTRQSMIFADQMVIRTLYFTVRSREFWRMLRRLAVILAIAFLVVNLLMLYVFWLYEVANNRQRVMGGLGLFLISLSIGFFGFRVAAFFTGVVLMFSSLIEFSLFIVWLWFLFLLPSLILLLVYYILYRKKRLVRGGASPPFNAAHVEEMHAKVFRLRNFYPETVIGWARRGELGTHWQTFKTVVFARSGSWDRFFGSVNARTGAAT